MRAVFVFMMAAVLVLSGCASTKPMTEVVYETKTVYVTPSPEQLRPVIAKRPMERPKYLAMPDYERELYLGDYSLDLFEKLGICNAQLKSIELTTSRVTGGKP